MNLEDKDMNKLTDSFKLRNGVEIPCVGFGTWRSKDGEIAENAVRKAIEVGYRHIDTAAAYKNEESVGRAIKNCGIAREEIFVTSKLWNTERGYDKAKKAFEETLRKLQLDYLDLYLVHGPAAAHQYENWDQLNLDTWKALTELYLEGKIRAIGVSNFLPHHIASLLKTEGPPMVDQIEMHPGFVWNETVELCRKNGILVEAWSPLGSGSLLGDPLLLELAEKYGKSVAQICLRWCLQMGTLPLPKSVTPCRIEENAKVFDFELCAEDMAKINDMAETGTSGFHPDSVDF